MLTKSDKEDYFTEWATRIAEMIFKNNIIPFSGFQPIVSVIVKDCDNLPGQLLLLETVRSTLSRFQKDTVEARTKLFNVFVDPNTFDTSGLSCCRCCLILCPKSPNEDIRVQDRSKKASKQLSAYSIENTAGLFCLGITRLQNPHYISDLLQSRFSKGQYSGISSVMMILTGTHLGNPRRSVIDLIDLVKNKKASISIPGHLTFAASGLLGHLIRGIPPPVEVPAYRHLVTEGKIANPPGKLFLPDVRSLTVDMLK